MFKIAVLVFCCSVFTGSEAQELGVIIERNVPVSMRDGTILRADVHRPDRGGPYPVLLQRTPYCKGERSFNPSVFVEAGYIAVIQDVRGRGASDGKWESFRRFETHEAEDGYDTVEWAAKLSGSTGKVGTFGASYMAFLQWRLAPLCPPSLVAMSASSFLARLEEEIGEGTIRPRRLRGASILHSPDIRRRENRPGVHARWEALRLWNEGESEKWINWLPWLELPQEVFEDETETLKYLLMNPQEDPLRIDAACKDIVVPNLEIVGWFDMANNYMLLHNTLIAEGGSEVARRGSRIIIGPWGHGATGRRVGKIDFGPSAALDTRIAQIRWFDYWLKGKQNGVDNDAPVKIFVMGDNKWRDESRWPLQRAKEIILFLTSNGHANTPQGNGRLAEKALQSLGKDGYVYNPRDPVPSLNPVSQPMLPADQRPLAGRQDILVYQTGPLNERLEVTGFPVIELYAESSAPDTDWFVKLIDVSPDGLALDVSTGVLRARYRNGLGKPELIKAGEVIKYTIRMRPTSNAFLPRHRIRLDITSSDFPQYDRNHNTAANQNADATLVTANQTIYHGGEQATRIILPWITNPVEEERQPEEEKLEPAQQKQTYPLHQAAADGDLEQIRQLLSKGADVNTEDTEQRVPLYYAAVAGKMEVVQLLVEAGADVNARGNNNWPPLYMAVKEDNIAIAEYLIAHGADANAGRPLEDTPYFSSIEMVQLLIAKGADVNAGPWTALHSAAEEGHRDIVELLIQKGADINAKNNKGRTPLYIAAEEGRNDIAELLIQKGADINAKDNSGRTPLYNAVEEGRNDIAELLIQKGADINAKNNNGKTPLYRAVEEGRTDIAELLIQKGADINAKDDRGRTPLYVAASANRIETVELLITATADINAKNNNGKTPLYSAVEEGRNDIAELLIQKGADINAKDNRGLTALHSASVEGHRDVTEMLLAKGAKVDERDDIYEFTALHYAARFGRKSVAEVLIANGADIKAKDKWDYQPIHWAAYHDRPDIVELLIAKGADVNAKTSLGQTPLQLAEPRRNTATIEVLRKHGAK